MSDQDKKEIDKVTGVETTGHEWDGLKELNNPLPRWWLWIFVITILWSIGYWVVYPAWPTLSGEGHRGGTVGAFNHTQYDELRVSQKEIVDRKGGYLERFRDSDFDTVMSDPELYAFAVAGGKAAFKDNCATCHGSGGAGAPGYPNLNDDDWIWGGTIDSIYHTLQYGIRSGHPEARETYMPTFGSGMLKREEIDAVSDYVLALSKDDPDIMQEKLTMGAAVFHNQCATCHGPKGQGDAKLGAPALRDAIWLYAGNKQQIMSQIVNPKHGVMPYWEGRLSDETIRQLAIYVHSLGGGELPPSGEDETPGGGEEMLLPEMILDDSHMDEQQIEKRTTEE